MHNFIHHLWPPPHQHLPAYEITVPQKQMCHRWPDGRWLKMQGLKVVRFTNLWSNQYHSLFNWSVVVLVKTCLKFALHLLQSSEMIWMIYFHSSIPVCLHVDNCVWSNHNTNTIVMYIFNVHHQQLICLCNSAIKHGLRASITLL